MKQQSSGVQSATGSTSSLRFTATNSTVSFCFIRYCCFCCWKWRGLPDPNMDHSFFFYLSLFSRRFRFRFFFPIFSHKNKQVRPTVDPILTFFFCLVQFFLLHEPTVDSIWSRCTDIFASYRQKYRDYHCTVVVLYCCWCFFKRCVSLNILCCILWCLLYADVLFSLVVFNGLAPYHVLYIRSMYLMLVLVFFFSSNPRWRSESSGPLRLKDVGPNFAMCGCYCNLHYAEMSFCE